jgi:hypothetical protein
MRTPFTQRYLTLLTLLASLLPLALLGPAGAQSSRSPLAQDPRLQQPVTVRWRKTSLYDALQELSKATGASINPERSLVDEPVMASAEKLPAWELMEQVSRLLHYTWVRSGGTPEKPNYLLLQDRKAREEEEAQLRGAELAVRAALERELARCRQLSQLSPDALAREQQKADQAVERLFSGDLASASGNPAAMRGYLDWMSLKSVTGPIGQSMLSLLDQLSPAQWTAMGQGQVLIYASNPRAEGEQPLPAGMEAQLRNGRPGFPLPATLISKLGEQAGTGIQKAGEMMQDRWSRAGGFRVTLRLNLNLGAQPVGMLQASPEPDDAGPIGAMFAMSGLNLIGAPTLIPEEKEDPAAREARLKQDSVLAREAVLKLPPLPEAPALPFASFLGKSYRAADVLPAIEAAYGVHVVGDAYSRQAMTPFPPPGDRAQPLFKVLDTLCATARDWERDGATIRLRSRTWAHDRRGEVPTRLLKRWQASWERNQGFDLEDLSLIAAALRDEQTETLLFAALELELKNAMDYIAVSTGRGPLRLLGSLLPAQRRQLLAGRPMPVAGLFPYQKAQLLQINPTQNRSMFGMALGAKPPRRPEQLQTAAITLETRGIPQQPAPGSPAGAPAPAAPAAPGAQPAAPAEARAGGAGGASAPPPVMNMTMPTQVAMLRVVFPDGQKDEYPITFTGRPVGSPTPGNRRQAPRE